MLTMINNCYIWLLVIAGACSFPLTSNPKPFLGRLPIRSDVYAEGPLAISVKRNIPYANLVYEEGESPIVPIVYWDNPAYYAEVPDRDLDSLLSSNRFYIAKAFSGGGRRKRGGSFFRRGPSFVRRMPAVHVVDANGMEGYWNMNDLGAILKKSQAYDYPVYYKK